MAHFIAEAVPVMGYAVPTGSVLSASGSASAKPDDNTSAYLRAYSSNPGTFKDRINKLGGKAYLSSKGWPEGLQDSMLRSAEKVPIRFFICDNSGSMIAGDGHKLVGNNKLVACSRWSELSESLKFHIDFSYHANLSSEFRFLNNYPPILVNADHEGGFSAIHGLLQESPSGATPLCRHITEVIEKIYAIKDTLIANNQKACLVIQTDGECSDGDMIAAMRPLKHLPVWTVIRLCTDEEKVVDYWNNVDKFLESNVDILDDLSGEASEIFELNPWITYGQPLHNMREFGVANIAEFDLLDERALTDEEMRKLLHSVLGGRQEEYPKVEDDFKALSRFISDKLVREKPMWDPVSKRLQPPVRMTALSRKFNNDPTCSIS